MRIAAIFLIAALSCFGYSGKLTEVTGPTQISRKDQKIEGKVSEGIEMFDVIETLKGRAGITFEDNTKVQVTEFSKLKIDEFVYDPASGKGKLAMKATSGTVRYASGLIAKNSRENVKVQTPTAVVSVRGTDFSMTVSEDGKSLIVLLPSIPLATGMPSVVGAISWWHSRNESSLSSNIRRVIIDCANASSYFKFSRRIENQQHDLG